ncbi:urocortin-3 [Protopterus annectens]|uniref:urocortin-3 n=1 Tax=Protopterus annectens TaxID=7888 RepID=UPI001CFAEE49|nr:urocortin-3 [Protopterus annectens]
MMHRRQLLLLLTILCVIRMNVSYKLFKSEASYSCLNEALAESKKNDPLESNIHEKRSFAYVPSDELSLENDEVEKRTFPATRYKYLTQTQLKGKMYQNSAKSDHRTKFTLSLDVPTNIMNILFNIAKAKNLRAKAAANARLMAQIGRRK